MSDRRTIACVIGTRPEAIKMAPVIRALRATEWARCVVIATAQHRELLDQVLARLDIAVDHDLDLMSPGQTPADVIVRLLPVLDARLVEAGADAVLAQGDTITVFGAALGAFHREIPFGHVEAGLRTHDLTQPFPEEGYRQMIARITRWHFAPTDGACGNLLAEDIRKERIYLTGNTGIDTLLQTVADFPPVPASGRRMILLTAHRRENFGAPLKSVFTAITDIVDRYPDVDVVYPVHPNPQVHRLAHSLLGGHAQIRLVPPQDYFEFVSLMRESTLILTDSGGVQEEAPSLAKPVLVLRERTERPEALEAGVSRLVGTCTERIVENVSELLDDPEAYLAMSQGASPFGDGKASARICGILNGYFVRPFK